MVSYFTILDVNGLLAMDNVIRAALDSIEAKMGELHATFGAKTISLTVIPLRDRAERTTKAFVFAEPLRELREHSLSQLEWVTRHTTQGESLSADSIIHATEQGMSEPSEHGMSSIIEMCDAGGADEAERSFYASLVDGTKSMIIAEYKREAS